MSTARPPAFVNCVRCGVPVQVPAGHPGGPIGCMNCAAGVVPAFVPPVPVPVTTPARPRSEVEQAARTFNILVRVAIGIAAAVVLCVIVATLAVAVTGFMGRSQIDSLTR